MSGRRIVRLSDRTRSPSPSFDRPAHRRSKVEEPQPPSNLPVRARLGGFVKDSTISLDKGRDGGKDVPSAGDHSQKGVRPPPGKYGPSPPPSYSSIVGKHTSTDKTTDTQNLHTTVTVKRAVISAPADSDGEDSGRKLKFESRERRNSSFNRPWNGQDISVSNTESRTIGRNSSDAISVEKGVSRSGGNSFSRSSVNLNRSGSSSQGRHIDGVRLERSIHGIDIDTPLTCGLIDTHMHIDLSLGSVQQSDGTSWTDYCKRHSARFPACYEGGIAIFCQPENFKCSSQILNEAFRSEKLWMTFGVHPHFADRYSEDSLRACLHKFKSKVVALGEIGLDSSQKNHISLEVQKEVFRSQAEIGIECKLPLVIHTRLSDGNAEALAFMRQFVPRDYPIHRHCFTGKWEEAGDWMSHFRSCYIGFTPLINTQPDLMEVARRIPLDRILVETDAPYFRNGLPLLEGGGRVAFTVPGDVIYTAAGIAKAKNLPIEAIICQTRLNTKALYGI